MLERLCLIADDRNGFSPDSIVIGSSPRMRAIFEYLALIGPGLGSVLVTGESGTGIAETHGNTSQAAARLGIKRSTLGDRIALCGLT